MLACPPDWRRLSVALSPVSRDCTGFLPRSEGPGRALLTHPKRTCHQSLQGARCRLENTMTFQKQPRKQGATSQPVTEVHTKASKNQHFLKRSQTPQCSNHDVQYTVNSYSSRQETGKGNPQSGRKMGQMLGLAPKSLIQMLQYKNKYVQKVEGKHC